MRGELLKLEINDRKFGPNVARVAATSGIKVLRTPTVRHEPMLSVSAFSISVRGACLGHFLILHEKQLSRLRRRLFSFHKRKERVLSLPGCWKRRIRVQ